ncbi:MAG: hypothetical protein WDW38_006871 [Sanguina aurantia]
MRPSLFPSFPPSPSSPFLWQLGFRGEGPRGPIFDDATLVGGDAASGYVTPVGSAQSKHMGHALLGCQDAAVSDNAAADGLTRVRLSSVDLGASV